MSKKFNLTIIIMLILCLGFTSVSHAVWNHTFYFNDPTDTLKTYYLITANVRDPEEPFGSGNGNFKVFGITVTDQSGNKSHHVCGAHSPNLSYNAKTIMQNINLWTPFLNTFNSSIVANIMQQLYQNGEIETATNQLNALFNNMAQNIVYFNFAITRIDLPKYEEFVLDNYYYTAESSNGPALFFNQNSICATEVASSNANFGSGWTW